MFKISIIIPYHNNLNQLSSLLNTIPEHPSIEVIIVDDHSDNPLIDVPHSRAKVIHQLPGKRWAGAARNTGILNAKGEYLLFADSDDIFTEGAFDVLERLDVASDLTYFKPTSIRDDGTASLRHWYYEEMVSNYLNNSDTTILYKFHVPWSKLYKREFILREDIRFDEVIASNDVLFSLKSAMLCHSFSVFDDVIYCVVESANSLTKKKSEIVIDSRFDALSRYNDFLIERNDKNLAAMSGHLKNACSFGFSKFMYRFFFCINKGYPIFYGFSHFLRALRYLRKNKVK
ncbi:glycosyltransferase family 2 protein [Vibrio diabolicus]|uniref:Putative glycosyltransferase EpsJ n=1 Tax=Vibrio parahaemolyticus TaxID=670 RepID=A0A7M1VKA5_VIBPH|nr:glycosyltransferase [Vibrio diabolicus]QOS15542.1 putative glycosyltransferase EpsJ [Vibrio parahaemolyticus]